MREDLIREDLFGNPDPRQFGPPPTTLNDVSSLFDQGPGPDFSRRPTESSAVTPQPAQPTANVGTQPLPRTNSDPFAGLPTPGTTINAGQPIQPQLNALFPTQPWPANSPYRNPAPAG